MGGNGNTRAYPKSRIIPESIQRRYQAFYERVDKWIKVSKQRACFLGTVWKYNFTLSIIFIRVFTSFFSTFDYLLENDKLCAHVLEKLFEKVNKDTLFLYFLQFPLIKTITLLAVHGLRECQNWRNPISITWVSTFFIYNTYTSSRPNRIESTANENYRNLNQRKYLRYKSLEAMLAKQN